jgi:hypothetical protein
MRSRLLKVGLGASIVVLALVAVVGVAVAQNWRLAPRYGTITLRSGFTPDPHRVSLTAGGPTQTTQGGCTAYVAQNPDYRLNYTAGSLPLNIYVQSASDTTLLINAPNGQWSCNDDSNGLNPLVSFPSPQSGQYDIFVGTYSPATAPATLNISELAPSW